MTTIDITLTPRAALLIETLLVAHALRADIIGDEFELAASVHHTILTERTRAQGGLPKLGGKPA
jgi:hypothetical protein